MAGSNALAKTKRLATNCAQCVSTCDPVFVPLVEGRTQVVFGSGSPNADLMFVGEAPGEDEDEKGEPFIGRKPGQAGAFLDERLTELGVEREDVYITNVVMCRPTKVLDGRRPANRPPLCAEIDNCAYW